ANHPFYTIDGWKRLDALCVGDRLATPRRIPEPVGRSEWHEDEIVMLAHMLGDGCFASRQPVHYTSSDLGNIEAVERAASWFRITPRRVRKEAWWHVYLPSRLARVGSLLEDACLGRLARSDVFWDTIVAIEP